MLGPEFDEIAAWIPNDDSQKASAESMLSARFAESPNDAVDLLDFGCGAGHGVDLVKSLSPHARYTGIDIACSPEVASRRRQDAEFVTFNGVDLPFNDQSFDVVYSRQVFEHVRHPDAAVNEIFRVLRPGGAFIGSLSNLEPYHSYSIFNFTPYGVYRLLTDNGFHDGFMRPGAEGMNLIIRQISARRIGWAELAYPMIDLLALVKRLDAKAKNYLKLRFSGHICFAATRPSA